MQRNPGDHQRDTEQIHRPGHVVQHDQPDGAGRVDLYAYQAHTTPMAVPKDSRIAVRLSSHQHALIRRAAEAEGTTVTNFTVVATVTHAREVLADRRACSIDDAAWAEFLAVLDRPVAHKPRLAKPLAEESIFDKS